MTTQLNRLEARYLRERAIAPAYAESAGARAVEAEMAHVMHFPYARRSQGGIVFPFLHPLTRAPHPTLMRIRYLPPPIVGGEPLRYAQPKGSGIEAFFDANVDWMAVFRDPSISVRITEGEAKALYLNQHWREMNRTVTVALGGVWNFREQDGKDLTPWLRMVRAASQGWPSRRIMITFDDDADTKPDIQRAERTLADLLGVRI